MTKRAFVVLLFVVFVASSLQAVVIEKVVAIVNNEAITLTELQEKAILIRHAV